MTQDKELIHLCRHLWEGMHPFRQRRRTALDFTFGRQWQREITLPDGRISTREREMKARGQYPITNNLTRQLVKSVVGKWRFLRSRHRCSAMTDGDEHALSHALDTTNLADLTDARAFEEFLISGLTVQLVDAVTHTAENVSPDRVFMSPFMREDASDCRMMGVLHDIDAAEVMRRFGNGDAKRCAGLLSLLRRCVPMSATSFAAHTPVTFDTPSHGQCLRVVEVWQRRPAALLHLHDPEDGSYYVTAADTPLCEGILRLNASRSKAGRPPLIATPGVADVWIHTWISPDGYVLESHPLPQDTAPSLVMRAYPMIDGEIHSMVEDILPQQEYINRLVQLLDDTLEHSAKGVLLYPTDQLPHGMTWEELRRIWSTPGAIIPFMRNSRNITPMQINSSGTSEGASEMLRTQLELFSRISGTTVASGEDGRNVNSADMLRRRMENETVALLDIMSSFEAFVTARDTLLGKGGGL